MSVLGWIQSLWRSGDFAILPRIKKDTMVGRVVPLCLHTDTTLPVQPIAEQIKKLAAKASKRRRGARKPVKTTRRKGQ